MFAAIASYFHGLLYDKEGNPDEQVHAGVVGSAGLIALSAWQVHQGHPIDPQGFGLGFGAIWGAVGAGKWATAKGDRA